MIRKGFAAVLVLSLLTGACSRLSVRPGEFASLKPSPATDLAVGDGLSPAMPFEPEPDPSDVDGRGVNPVNALRSAEAAQARWRRQQPIDYSKLPVHPGEALLRKPGSVAAASTPPAGP